MIEPIELDSFNHFLRVVEEIEEVLSESDDMLDLDIETEEITERIEYYDAK